MELIPIGDTKLKITLDDREMAAYPLRRRSGNRATLLRLFREAKEKCGFDTTGSRVFVQMYPGRCGGCELYITKLCIRERSSAQEDAYPIGAFAEEYNVFPRPAIYSFTALSHLLSTCACLLNSGYTGTSQAYCEPGGSHFYLTLDCETFFAGEHLGTLCPASAADYIAEHCDTFCTDAVALLGPLA